MAQRESKCREDGVMGYIRQTGRFMIKQGVSAMSTGSLKKIVTAVISLLLVIVLLSGCEWARGDKWLQDMTEGVKTGWQLNYGEEPDDVEFKEYKQNMSESHRMMAAMILNNAGMDSDLDSYEEVFLCIVKIGDKEEAMVIADGKSIYP